MNPLRVGLAAAGFLLAVLSVAFDSAQLAWAAIALLVASLIVRLLLRKRQDRKSCDERPL